MERVKSIEAFRMMQDLIVADVDPDVPMIIVPAGTCGQASGANGLIRIAKRELLAKGLTEQIQLRITGCHGFCQMEPSVLVYPRGTFYPRVTLHGMEQIVDAVAAGTVLTDLLYLDPETGRRLEKQSDIPFFKRQMRSILGRNEKIDPIRIYHYIENKGYSSLARVLEQGSPEAVVREVKAAGLRGRGGAGFPTGMKWELLAKQQGSRSKFLVCNADEGDPGAYMDRSVLEGNPHSVIEGMIIGAFATGATDGVIYVRNEYPLAIKHLIIALRQAREFGLLGSNILGTPLSFDIRLVKGAGAFVCGEETALIRSIEGKTGEPRQRPPFPVQRGIDGNPTAINNVETWANIPLIFTIGAREFARIGAPNNTGTKIFSLVGKIKNTGLVEVPMGITIQEIVNEIGGGPVGTARIKAVQTGGPSGGCIPAAKLDLPVDYENLSTAGTIMGSGGMIVMDENTCMVDIARYFTNFLREESCGKCFTCRKGIQRMNEILEDIAEGRGKLDQLSLLEELATVVRDTSMCGLGQSAANPVLSTLRYFRDEYEQHIVDKRCGAFVCKELVGAPCQSACPLGTEAWRYIAHLARGEYEMAYKTIRETNPFPSVCARVCDHKCEERCRLGTTGNRPVAIRALKRFITDIVDPRAYQAPRPVTPPDAPRIAVVGSCPAGLTAAHYLSLDGFKVTVFEMDSRPGGMLISGIPSYRLRREVLQKEIESLIDENIAVRCDTALGRDFTIDDLFDQGFAAVCLALGAHKSRRLNIEGEEAEGVYPAIQFLKEFNLRGKKLARGRVGIIGGGNSAVDAARVALRLEGVESVTIFYRRTRQDMPALKEEVDAALQEGVRLEALVSPLKIRSREGRLTGIVCCRNKLGAMDSGGRRHPTHIIGSDFSVPLDVLIVTIGDEPDIDYVSGMGVAATQSGTLQVNAVTLETTRPGVFAAGDVVTGPDTVVDAIAAGRRAAEMIACHVRGGQKQKPAVARIPRIHVEPAPVAEDEIDRIQRAEPPSLPVGLRRKSFSEVEMSLSTTDALREARRCLRCDLEFTERGVFGEQRLATGGSPA